MARENIQQQTIYQKALQHILNSGQDALPYDVFQCCVHHGWAVVSIQEYCEKYDFDPDFMMEKVIQSTDGASIFLREHGRYCILYNAMKEQSHIRWVIAHEIGHIVLDHFQQYPGYLSRHGVLLEDKYASFEREANLFARFLLAPPPLLDHLDISDALEIQTIADIPQRAARHTSLFLKGPYSSAKHAALELREELLRRFSDFCSQYHQAAL
ncbi:ImmA/IrrE family metallo-endopeptidase [Eubacteriales bacterium OttesenSCG-928-M02]|nr:ImmA/IrrE family metallo-endopeptidase [Eubacteriales bacterium OttesenSCG-928-M02]